MVKKIFIVFVALIGLGSLCAFNYSVKGITHFETNNSCNTEYEKPCPDCAGKGMVKCSSCLGRGELRKSCNKCNGQGTIREVCGSEIIGTENCPQCKGSGWYDRNITPTICRGCNGSGYYRDREGDRISCSCDNGYRRTERAKCDRCHGKGNVNLERSKYCYRNCNNCFGDGYLITACNSCNQTGMKPCTRCNSTGKID